VWVTERAGTRRAKIDFHKAPVKLAIRPGSPLPLTRSKRMSRKLKVFRTASGFYDAYVAAPSRKAALAAWGAKGDLFAREAAEEVTDPALMAEPLAKAGQVIKRPRGSFAVPAPAEPRPKPPSRAALDKAEAALTQFEKSAAAELAGMREQEERLAQERAALNERQRAQREKLVRRRDREREKFAARAGGQGTGRGYAH